MKRLFITAILMSLVTITAFSQSKKDEEVISIVKKAVEAQVDFDSAILEKLYASDYIEISPVGEVDEREKAIGFYKLANSEEAKKASPNLELDEFNVRNYGKFSIIVARLTFSSKQQMIPAVKMRVVFVCRKEKGSWKISSAQYTGIRPPRPPQPTK
jgi:Domain of unknown function (DUF4440)